MARYFVLTALVSILAGYGIGLVSGWLMFKPSRKELNALRAAAEKNAVQPQASPATTATQQAPATGPPDPNLSFYKTLPAGKAILGTGLNPEKTEPPPPRSASVPPNASPAPPASGAGQLAPNQPANRASLPLPASEVRVNTAPEKTAVKPLTPVAPPATPLPVAAGPDQMKKAQLKGKYVVQVASYQSKSDAETARSRLQDAGLPAYVVESLLKDKGTVYRVRVGKHLEPAVAEELAAKAGRNAIVILE